MTVFVPTPLRRRCGGKSELQVEATNVRSALAHLAINHAPLYGCICDETGAVRRHINLFVNQDHIRDIHGLDSPLTEQDTVYIFTAVSGG